MIHVNDFFKPGKALSPTSGDYFEINLTENQCPFIKVWNGGVVLISSMDYKD